MGIEEECSRRLALQIEYGGCKKEVNEIQPLVSVVIVTYQHAPYIRQCLDSILSQEVDFSYELIIGEDGSTDGTKEICIEYADKYKDKIRLFLRDRKLTRYFGIEAQNIGFNAYFAREAARGEYIAICEGDDYWIDKHKLIKQVKVLRNEKYALCCTSFVRLDKERKVIQRPENEYTLRDLIVSNFVGTLTVMFKAQFRPRLDPSTCVFWFGDWSMWIRIAEHGDIYNIKECTAAYRINNNGRTKSTSVEKRYSDIEKYYDILAERYGNRYKEAIRTGRAISRCNWARDLSDNGEYRGALKKLSESVSQKLSSGTIFYQTKGFLYILSNKWYRRMKKTISLVGS